MNESLTTDRPLRIAICQREVPHYRGSVFNLLGRQPGIELWVYHGQGPVAQSAGAKAESYRSVDAQVYQPCWVPMGLYWHSAHWSVIDPQRFDLAILPWDARCISVWPAIFRARRTGVPVVLWGHGRSKHAAAWRDAIRGRQGRSASGVLLYTRTVADYLIEKEGFDAGRVFVAQNALDQGPIQAARQHWLGRPDELRRFAAEHGLDPRCTVVFVSRLLKENRIDMMIRALARLREEEPMAKLVIIGKGPDEPRLRVVSTECGVAEQVVFTGAVYDDMTLAPWMLNSTLFCYPVNIGLSIMHAYGYGLPVVTSDDIASHNPEIEALVDGENGLLYQDGEVDDMLSKWRRIIRDTDLRARMSERALQAVGQRYTLANMVQGFLDVTRLIDGVRRRVVAS